MPDLLTPDSPGRLGERPRAGALVVPYVVDEKRAPVSFAFLDPARVEKCAQQGRCGICGGKIRRGPIAFIGPDDKRSCFADPWMHVACARLAMQQCPFLAGRRSWRDAEGEHELISMYARNMVLYTATNWRSHKDQLGHWHFEAIAGLVRA